MRGTGKLSSCNKGNDMSGEAISSSSGDVFFEKVGCH